MKDLFQTLVEQLKSTNASTRLVMGVGVLLITALSGYSVWRGHNPHMAFLYSDLDNSEVSAVTSALGKAGIRFEVPSGGAPYTVFVDSSQMYEARSVVAQDSALAQGPRGIDTSSGSSAFDASIERVQKANARLWEEVEKSIETMTWIERAKVISSSPGHATLGRKELPTVSVTLRTKVIVPDPLQSQAVANLVVKAFHTSPENVSIVDHRGQTLFDGSRNEGLDEVLAFERAFDREQTERAQELLDSTFGPGLARASVRGEWTYERTESVDERLQPKGSVLRESTTKSSTPGAVSAGGPAGVQENLTIAPSASNASSDPATRQDTEKQYAFGTTTTHSLQTQPKLVRLTLGLIVDSSLDSQLAQAEGIVKSAVGFNPERGDTYAGNATPMYGIERDEEGNVIPATPPKTLEAPNPWINLGLEHGIEALAALVFIVVLLRALKSSGKPLQEAADAKSGAGAGSASGKGGSQDTEIAPETLDPEVLARRQVEDLIDSDPERVSALLSRWAMGDDYYTEASA